MKLLCKYFKIRKFEKEIIRFYVFVCMCVFFSSSSSFFLSFFLGQYMKFSIFINFFYNLSFLITILENIHEAWFFSNECELLTNKLINTLNWYQFINKKKYLLCYIIINILLIILWETRAVKEKKNLNEVIK